MDATRLVVVSNRVAPARGAAQAGGLAVGLVDILRSSDGLWFGWSGQRSDSPDVRIERAEGYTQATIDLTVQEFQDYYNGFANRCLWPLLHFRMDLTRFDQNFFAAYRSVNARFARSLFPLLRRDDLVWVHDYHLFFLGSELRAFGAAQRLGFFLHTPFPPRDLLTTLPRHDQIVRALFDYDVIGFQTLQDLQRFHEYIRLVPGARIEGDRVEAYGRGILAKAFPIGIDVDDFHNLAVSEPALQECARMRSALNDRDQVICVDRLDYSKGLVRRMAAYEMLLANHPEAHRNIVLLQVAPVSRGELQAYRDFRRQLERTAVEINGRFGQFDWTPVHYVNRAIPRQTLAGLYRASRIAMVTPVRDGMNLVAKEYVAAQDGENPGILVLSRFAGAAQQMDAALLVNPYDTGEVAAALQRARLMSLAERRERHQALMQDLHAYDVKRWRNEFLSALRSRENPARSRLRAARS